MRRFQNGHEKCLASPPKAQVAGFVVMRENSGALTTFAIHDTASCGSEQDFGRHMAVFADEETAVEAAKHMSKDFINETYLVFSAFVTW